MASRNDQHPPGDLTVCSICFEKFRTPRILPCAHVFCHGCISAYIISSCQSKEAPVGFFCPLCRVFVPSPTAVNNPAQWADGLPVCKMLEKLNNQDDTNLCAACQRENEEEEATEFCINCEESICGTCAKYHRRILTTRNHLVCKLNDPSLAMQFFNFSIKTGNCPAHPEKEIELHCNDHKKVCCSLCVSTEHRNCTDVTTIQSCVQEIKEEGDVQKLQQKVKEFEQELLAIKKKQEDNISALDIASDNFAEDIKKIRREINDHLDKLEKEHLDEIGEMTKTSKKILSKAIDSLSDRIHLSKHFTKSLENIEGKTNACFLKDYRETRERFEALERQTMQLREHEITLESNLSRELFQVANLARLSTNRVVHSQREISTRNLGLNPETKMCKYDVSTHDYPTTFTDPRFDKIHTSKSWQNGCEIQCEEKTENREQECTGKSGYISKKKTKKWTQKKKIYSVSKTCNDVELEHNSKTEREMEQQKDDEYNESETCNWN